MIWALYPDIVGIKHTPASLRNILAKTIKKHLPIKVARKSNLEVERGYIYIGGFYYNEADRNRETCIEINFINNPLDKYISIDRNQFKWICESFANVILHEIIHMKQYRSRGFKVSSDYVSNASLKEIRCEQAYLGNPDEIEAYGFNIASELLKKFNNNTVKTEEYIKKIHNRRNTKSHSLTSYLKAFDYDHEHPVIDNVKKHAISYIPQAFNGKPFKTSDWLSY